MRIAIYHNLPSGGGKRALYEITRRLADYHQSLDIFALSSANHDYCDVRPFAREHYVFPFNALPMARSPFGRINQMTRLADIYRRRQVERMAARQIDAGGYDLVFVHNCQFGQSTAVLKYLCTPTLYYCAEPPRFLYEPKPDRPYLRASPRQQALDQFDPLPSLYRRTLMRLDREYTRSASMVAANSAYSVETIFRTYGIFSRVIYLGVDTENFRPLTLPREPYVISVGSLVPNKGYQFIIESLGRIKPGLRPALVIVSNYINPNEQAFLDDHAARHGVKVTYHSLIPDEELVQLYNRASLTVYAPIMEPFGFVPLESMACGTPVVGVREAGVRESIKHGLTGLLAERSPEEFAGAVESLLCDPNRRDQMGRNGLAETRENWQWDITIRNLEKLFAVTSNSNHL